jgi:hypothetical protein
MENALVAMPIAEAGRNILEPAMGARMRRPTSLKLSAGGVNGRTPISELRLAQA